MDAQKSVFGNQVTKKTLGNSSSSRLAIYINNIAKVHDLHWLLCNYPAVSMITRVSGLDISPGAVQQKASRVATHG